LPILRTEIAISSDIQFFTKTAVAGFLRVR
jgi:hypothetical protein